MKIKSSLTPREKFILLEGLAAPINLSSARIGQIERQALARLRNVSRLHSIWEQFENRQTERGRCGIFVTESWDSQESLDYGKDALGAGRKTGATGQKQRRKSA